MSIFDMSMSVHTGIIIGLALFFGVILAGWMAAERSDRREDAELWRDWQAAIDNAALPPWDGQTWDWPEGGLADYFFGADGQPPAYADGGQATPVPSDPPDGPIPPGPALPCLDDEADRFIQAMRDRTDAFITAMSRPALAPAGSAPGW
jgi:hypothetical protein